MNNKVALQLVCLECSASIDAGSEICPSCGAPVSAEKGVTHGSTQAQQPMGLQNLVHNRWAVLGMLFLALAALGLPLLWASRAFSRVAKVVLTIVVVGYTALIVWLIAVMLRLVYAQLIQLWAAWGG